MLTALLLVVCCFDGGEDKAKDLSVDPAIKEAQRVLELLQTSPWHLRKIERVKTVETMLGKVPLRVDDGDTLRDEDLTVDLSVRNKCPDTVHIGEEISQQANVTCKVNSHGVGRAIILVWVGQQGGFAPPDFQKRGPTPDIPWYKIQAQYYLAQEAGHGSGGLSAGGQCRKLGPYKLLAFVAVLPLDGSEPRVLKAGLVEANAVPK